MAARKSRSKRKGKGRKPKLGTGARFKALKKKLGKKRKGKKKIKDPGALAAAIGRKKWGAKRFAKLSAAGRKRAARRRKK